MTTLVIDQHVLRAFDTHVRKLLEAKAVVSREESPAFLVRLLGERAALHTMRVRRPRPGEVHAITRNPVANAPVLDTTLALGREDRGARAPVNVLIRSVYGLAAGGSPTRAAPTESDPEEHVVLVWTSRHLTLFADVLPGLDLLYAVRLFANERLPLRFLIRRPARPGPSPASRIDTLVLRDPSVHFAAPCVVCEGQGSLTCRRCDGEGGRSCDRCGGSGIYRPRRTCQRCGGSGRFIGRLGDDMGSCHPCKGEGHFPEQRCNACRDGWNTCPTCGGERTAPCYACRGSTVRKVRFQWHEGRFRGSVKAGDGWQPDYPAPERISLFERGKGGLAASAGASALVREIEGLTTSVPVLDLTRERELTAHATNFGRIERCLVKKLAGEGIRETRPIRVRRPGSSLRRVGGKVVYEFPLAGRLPRWARDGHPPFPPGTPIRFEAAEDGGARRPVDLGLQPESPRSRRGAAARIVLQGLAKRSPGHALAVRFDVEVDLGDLPEELWIRSAAIPPAERKEVRHLKRWCSAESRDHPVLDSILFSGDPDPPVPEVEIEDELIRGNRAQARAVSLALSPLPLALIKGPPGTGKTRVITEIVRHLALRRRRVLVCSQKHQAVRNVLQRLQEDPDSSRLLIVRHAARREKLFEEELPHHGRHVDLGARVAEAVAEALERHRRSLGGDAEVREALRRSAAATRDLATAHRDADRDRAAVAGRHESEVAAADLEHRRREAEATSALARRQRELEREIRRARRRRGAAGRRGDRARRRKEDLSKRYRRMHGEDPPHDPRTLGRPRLTDRLVPTALAGGKILAARHARAGEEIESAGAERAESETAIARAEEERGRADRAHQADLARIRQARDRRREELSERRCRDLEAIERRLAEIAASTAAARASGRERAGEHGLEIDEHVGAEEIDAIVRDLEARGADLTRKVEFMGRWLAALEAHPDAVAESFWDGVRVVLSTCVGVGSLREMVRRGRTAFDLVIVDEAAHATVTQTTLPLLYGEKALLLGDEMQLPPVHLDECLTAEGEPCRDLERPVDPGPVPAAPSVAESVRMSDCWLERSLFEWVWRGRERVPRVMLNRQFRMHPDIARFVGEVFYPEGLESGVSAEERSLRFGEFQRPICLIPTSEYGPERHEVAHSPGYSNRLEARIVRRVLQIAEEELGESASLGVITPYKHQTHRIRQEIEALLPTLVRTRLSSEDVASVDRFQGSERDVIVVSFVRSPRPCKRCWDRARGVSRDPSCPKCRGRGFFGSGLRFVRDLRRLNVAFSRARKMLVLIGDIRALTNERLGGAEEGARVLARFQRYIEDRGRVLWVWEDAADG